MNLKKIFITFAIFSLVFPASVFAKEDKIVIPKNFPAKYDATYVTAIKPLYKSISKEPVVMVALDMLKGTNGEFSRNAIMGNNLSNRPIKVAFNNLSEVNEKYANFDALGWKKGKQLGKD